ncbi:MAG: DUF1778 domain-containing protein, partial [Candidatus Adiutrix sp.]|nr:DUF1778 domain-containing protein [Candidatus Adiutrix sp.]
MPSTDTINIRVSSEQKALIDQAAIVLGQTRTTFILENVVRLAKDVLLDRTEFHLNAEQWAEFNRLLDAPPQENPGLRKLLAGKAPWD